MKIQSARSGQRTIAAAVVRGILYLGVVLSIASCDLAYQPLCRYDCYGPVGSENIGKVK
jgi:hypothetical protein